jgi:hypothetical protein
MHGLMSASFIDTRSTRFSAFSSFLITSSARKLLVLPALGLPVTTRMLLLIFSFLEIKYFGTSNISDAAG